MNPNNYYLLSCIGCSIEFRHQDKRQKYHNRECYDKNKPSRKGIRSGRTAWNKGIFGYKTKPHSEETKQKIRQSNVNTWSRPEIRAQSIGRNNPMFGKKTGYSGEKHHNWKGGISAENKMQRSRFLQVFQPQVFDRDNYTCQVCLQYGGSLQADHIKSWADYPELRFDIENCRTLCMACHYYVTFKRKLPAGVVWGHNLSKRVTS